MTAAIFFVFLNLLFLIIPPFYSMSGLSDAVFENSFPLSARIALYHTLSSYVLLSKSRQPVPTTPKQPSNQRISQRSGFSINVTLNFINFQTAKKHGCQGQPCAAAYQCVFERPKRALVLETVLSLLPANPTGLSCSSPFLCLYPVNPKNRIPAGPYRILQSLILIVLLHVYDGLP